MAAQFYIEAVTQKTFYSDKELSDYLTKDPVMNQTFKILRESFKQAKPTNWPYYLLSSLQSGHHAIEQIESAPDFESLRNYNFEDHDDNVAIEILWRLNLPVDDRVGFLFFSPQEALACLKLVNSQTIPPYGRLTEFHHDNCWRYYRALQVEKFLNENFDRNTPEGVFDPK